MDSQPIATTYESKPVTTTSYESKPITVASTYESKPFATTYESKPVYTSYESKPIATSSYESKPIATSSYESKPIATSSYESKPYAVSSTFESKPVYTTYESKQANLDSVPIVHETIYDNKPREESFSSSYYSKPDFKRETMVTQPAQYDYNVVEKGNDKFYSTLKSGTNYTDNAHSHQFDNGGAVANEIVYTTSNTQEHNWQPSGSSTARGTFNVQPNFSSTIKYESNPQGRATVQENFYSTYKSAEPVHDANHEYATSQRFDNIPMRESVGHNFNIEYATAENFANIPMRESTVYEDTVPYNETTDQFEDHFEGGASEIVNVLNDSNDDSDLEQRVKKIYAANQY